VASVELLVKETCNAAVTGVRRGEIKKSDIDRVIEVALRLSSKNVKMFPQAELMESAIRIALGNSLTIYDSLYISLAQTLRAPLLSLDLRQEEVAARVGIESAKP